MKNWNLLPWLSCLLISITVVAQKPQATTKAGEISGLFNDDKTIEIYRGVPFAAPPVGDLRWKAPQPLNPWAGIKACDNFAPSPMQTPPVPFMMWTEEFIAPPEPLSEDCLYLNIWAPSDRTEKKPVFVWIYGGGFVSGSSACDIYDGEMMAKEDIVFVSINYRVGIFGFMAHPELTAESPHKSSGNYGIADQIAALRWVNENIASFGGDPERVTIAGQSAGSISVQSVVASPLARGLMSGAIAQSGASLNSAGIILSDAEKTGMELSEKLNGMSINQLRELTADSILSLGSVFPWRTFVPIVDRWVIPESMPKLFAKGAHNDVALMAGWVAGDGNLFGPADKTAVEFQAFAKERFGNRSGEFLKAFPAGTDEEAKAAQLDLGMLQFAGYPSHLWAKWNKSPVFLYQFSFVPTDKPDFPNYGAFHTSEVPFALRTLHKWNRPWQERDMKVQRQMSSYWINFIKTGDPNGENLPKWTPYSTRTVNIMEFRETPSMQPGMYNQQFEFFESLK